MKPRLFVLARSVALLASSIGVFAQTGVSNTGEESLDAIGTGELREIYCPPHSFSLRGPTIVKKGVAQTYNIVGVKEDDPVSSTVYEIWSGGELIDILSGSELTYSFDQVGRYVIKTILETEYSCKYALEQPIRVMKGIFTYMGPGADEVELVTDRFEDQAIYVVELLSQDGILREDDLLDNWYYIQHADVLLLDSYALGSLLERISALEPVSSFDMQQVDVYVISNINQGAFRRLTSRYHDLLGLEKIFVIEKEHLGSLMTSLFLGKDLTTSNFVRVFASSVQGGSPVRFMSYLVDYLLYSDFPLSTITFLLLVPVLALVITICRQVIGLSVYGVFHPLLFAFSLHIIGVDLTILFFITAMLSVIITNRAMRKIYLLYSAKISLMLAVYSILSFAVLRVVPHLGDHLSYAGIHELYIVFPVLILLTVAKSVVTKKSSLLDKRRRLGLFEFVAVTFFVYHVLTSLWIQNLLLGYPELLLAVLILNFVIGRYTGLQFVEYIRFFALIRAYWADDEGEEE